MITSLDTRCSQRESIKLKKIQLKTAKQYSLYKTQNIRRRKRRTIIAPKKNKLNLSLKKPSSTKKVCPNEPSRTHTQQIKNIRASICSDKK